jgi:hypothetical protein
MPAKEAKARIRINKLLEEAGWLFFLLIFLFLSLFSVAAQLPNYPHMYLVTVDPETGYDNIIWRASSTPPSVDWYTVGRVERINPNEPPVIYIIAQVHPPDTIFINTTTTSHLKSVGYTVWAYGGGMFSTFDAPDSTIFLSTIFNFPDQSISLNWNDYNKWRGSIANYKIYKRHGPNNYELLAMVPEGTNTLVLGGVESNTEIELFVVATHEDQVRQSTSNVAIVNTTSWGSDQGNDLNFKILNRFLCLFFT